MCWKAFLPYIEHNYFTNSIVCGHTRCWDGCVEDWYFLVSNINSSAKRTHTWSIVLFRRKCFNFSHPERKEERSVMFCFVSFQSGDLNTSKTICNLNKTFRLIELIMKQALAGNLKLGKTSAAWSFHSPWACQEAPQLPWFFERRSVWGDLMYHLQYCIRTDFTVHAGVKWSY